MRCQICREEIVGTAYLVERFAPRRDTLVLNVCAPCLGDLLGPGTRSRLDRALVTAAWVADPLPGF